MDNDKIISELGFLKPRPSVDSILAFDCPPEQLPKAAAVLRDDFDFRSLEDIASIDMGEDASPRFGAVYHFYSHSKKKYVRLVAMCADSDKPVLPSLCSVFKGADWHEREAFDLMGVVFDGHPSLRRIMMWDTYPWHPLRKDFPLAGRPAPLPESFEDNESVTKVIPAPEEGGPFHAPSCGTTFAPQREPRSIDSACSDTDNV